MNAALTVGSLFAGIGGFDLGLERAGMRSVWQSEIDPYCQRVLARHWPDVLRVPDVRNVGADTVPYVDVICGGFPCQDISLAGEGLGIGGARSGLWSEYARIVGEIRPRYVLVENVSALLGRGLGVVLADLSALGFDAEWDCLPAAAFGAPHRRDRLWLVAYPDKERRREGLCESAGQRERQGTGDAVGGRELQVVADAESVGCDGFGAGKEVRDRGPLESPGRDRSASRAWPVEPDVGRVAYGVPARVDRVRALGNALVPKIAQWIGERIVSYENERTAA